MIKSFWTRSGCGCTVEMEVKGVLLTAERIIHPEYLMVAQEVMVAMCFSNQVLESQVSMIYEGPTSKATTENQARARNEMDRMAP